MTEQSDTCKSSLLFIKEVLTGEESNPLKRFEKDFDSFNFEGENNIKLWNFFVLKTSEQDSTLRPLSSVILQKNVIELIPELTSVAALYLFQLNEANKQLKSVENNLNDTMKDFHLDEKVVLTNNLLDDYIDWTKLVLSKSSLESLNHAKKLLESTTASKDGVKRFEDVLEPFIQEKLEKESKLKLKV